MSTREYRAAHSEEIRERNRLYRIAHREEIRAQGLKYARRYREEHLEAERERQRLYRLAHPEQSREWKRSHPEKVHAGARAYRIEHAQEVHAKNHRWEIENRKRRCELSRKHRSIHPEDEIIRHAVARAMRYGSCRKASKSFEYVGCTPGFLRNHLESLFLPGMSWENCGEWHVDHIVPLAWWDLKNHPEHMLIAAHYSNLQPMWGKENLSKGARSAAKSVAVRR